MPNLKLTIHPDATNNFNKDALSLLELCKESKYSFPNSVSQSKFPQPFVATTITGQDITDIGDVGMKNGIGETIASFFWVGNKQIGLDGEDYKKFVRLCESVQKAIRPSSTISRIAVQDLAFQWLSKKYSEDISDSRVDYLLPKLETEIKEFEICIPIGELFLQSTIDVGRVQIRPITKELLDKWKSPLLEKGSEDDIAFKEKFFEEKLRKPYQGRPAAFIKLQAEPKAAKEIALYETERSLAMFRVFTPAAMLPQISCHIAIMGSENVETISIITFHNDVFSSLTSENADESQRPMGIDNNMISQMYASGLAIVSQLLLKNDLTKFEQTLLDALMLYSHATREKELSSKIIYVLAALEGVFLKNDTESIQQNLRERLATIIGKKLDQKKAVIKNINTIYGARSAFLHHAHTISQIEELERFMYYAFIAITTAIQNHSRYPSNQEFIQAIDDLKLNGTLSQ